MLMPIFFILCLIWTNCVTSYGGFDSGTPGCDTAAALKCEVEKVLDYSFRYLFIPFLILQYEFLLCKLFNGPANDQTTLCNCAKVFFGECIRKAGVTMYFKFSNFVNLFGVNTV